VDDPGNPFGVPLLDLMQLQGWIATSKDRECAARSVSWGDSTGRELDPRPVLELPPTSCELRYPAAASLPDGILYAPPSMDFKWVLAIREGRLLAARSWTGAVEAVADARREGGEIVLGSLRVADPSALRICTNVVDVFDWLIRVHVWNQRLPLPVDEAGASLLEKVPLAGFGPFGKALFCAARSWRPPPPPRPLRSDGEVILSARKGDVDALERAVTDGADVDAPGTASGFTALHVAVMRGDARMLGRLLELGANVGARADRGSHALELAVVRKAPPAIFDLLAGTKMDLHMANVDGFTAMHAAAEVDNPTIIPWLVAHGVALEARTRHGHTPLHIAAALGHVAAAQALLDAGADADASSPSGTPLDVARGEKKDRTIALLSAGSRTRPNRG
jgi:ankyrin repeat protein